MRNPNYSQIRAAYKRAIRARSSSEKRLRGLHEALKRRRARVPGKMVVPHLRAMKHAEALRRAAHRRFVVAQRRFERGSTGEVHHRTRGLLLAAAKKRADRYGRKENPMARSAAQRRAFRKMLAGLRRYKAAKHRRNPSKRRRVRARKRRTVTVRVNPRKRRHNMARRRVRRRRARATIMVNPRRRRHRRRNPRRFHMRHRHHRRRNPGMVGGVVKTLIPAALVGGVAGAVEAKFLTGVSEPLRVGGKLVLGILAMVLLRRRPAAAAVVGSSIFATLGYEGGVRAAGGVVAGSAQAAAPQIKALIREDPRAMSALVRSFRGMGVLAVDNNVALRGNELHSSALPPGTYQQGVSLQ